MPYIKVKARYDNTVMKEIQNSAGDLNGYDIAPIDGYVLHNSVLDTYYYDEETQESKELTSKGYSKSSCSVEPEYDFDTNPYEIHAIKIDSIGDDGVIY